MSILMFQNSLQKKQFFMIYIINFYTQLSICKIKS